MRILVNSTMYDKMIDPIRPQPIGGHFIISNVINGISDPCRLQYLKLPQSQTTDIKYRVSCAKL